jgi:hypothetical protein
MPMTPKLHRSLAAETFNQTWTLLESARSPQRDRDALTAALASRYHWRIAGSPRNRAISDWLVSRVFSSLGEAPQARLWAHAALEAVEEHDLGPFLEGSVHEALARAAAIGGDSTTRDRHLAAARDALELVTDDEEREVLAADIAAAGG